MRSRLIIHAKDAVNSFLNPFNIDDPNTMYCILSGSPVPENITQNILNAETLGASATETFIKDRLEKKDNFYEPVKRMNLKTMGYMSKSVLIKTGKNKMVAYKQQGNIAFQLFVKSQADDIRVELAHVMIYPLTPSTALPQQMDFVPRLINQRDFTISRSR